MLVGGHAHLDRWGGENRKAYVYSVIRCSRMPRMKVTSVRLPKEMLDEIERISREEGVDRGTLIRRLLAESLREYRVRRALDLYRSGKVSLWRAAELAGITYREALEELRRRNIPFSYSLEDLEADLEWAGAEG